MVGTTSIYNTESWESRLKVMSTHTCCWAGLQSCITALLALAIAMILPVSSLITYDNTRGLLEEKGTLSSLLYTHTLLNSFNSWVFTDSTRPAYPVTSTQDILVMIKQWLVATAAFDALNRKIHSIAKP